MEIDTSLGRLIYRERYDADLAAVFYDVNFYLVTSDADTLDLGNGRYHENDWTNQIKVLKIGEWHCISTHDSSHAKIGLARKHAPPASFTFSPLDLRDDMVWRASNTEIPAWVYSGSSVIDSIVSDRIYVEYRYRLGLEQPYEYKKQRMVYRFDTNNQELITEMVYQAMDNER